MKLQSRLTECLTVANALLTRWVPNLLWKKQFLPIDQHWQKTSATPNDIIKVWLFCSLILKSQVSANISQSYVRKMQFCIKTGRYFVPIPCLGFQGKNMHMPRAFILGCWHIHRQLETWWPSSHSCHTWNRLDVSCLGACIAGALQCKFPTEKARTESTLTV